MPPLSQHHSSETTKLLLIGESGAGKTGALAALAAAGYNLRIIDLDNGLDILKDVLTGPKSKYPPEAINRVMAKTLTEPMRNINGKLFPAKASVWPTTIKLLSEWKDTDADGKEISLGPVTSWTSKDVLCIDSLTMLSTAAMNFQQSLNGHLGNSSVTQNEWRRDIGGAQQFVESLLQTLYDTSIKCNVVVNSHIALVRERANGQDLPEEKLPMVGFPSAIGASLPPRIPRYFNSVLLVKTVGSGMGTRHRIHTTSQGIVNAKTSAPTRVKPEYDIFDGLAKYFEDVKSSAAPAA